MSLSAETLNALQQLMAQNKELLARVQTTQNSMQAAFHIAEAAAKNGISVSEAELIAHLEEASSTLTNQALSDQQLEAVSGGLSDDGYMALISIFSFGIGCAAISFAQAAGGNFYNSSEKHTSKKYC